MGSDERVVDSVLVNIGGLHIALSDSKTITQNDKKKHLSEALDYCHKAYKLAEEIKSFPLINAAAGNLQRAYKNLNNPSKALEYADIVIASNDSMFKEEKTKAIAEVETKYETEKKEKEIIIKDNQIHNFINNKKITTIQIYSLVFVLVLLLIIAILIYRKSKQNKQLMAKDKQLYQTQKALIDAELKTILIEKQKIEHELVFKNKEIENLALYISQKSDFLEDINSVIAENKIALKSTEEQKNLML